MRSFFFPAPYGLPVYKRHAIALALKGDILKGLWW